VSPASTSWRRQTRRWCPASSPRRARGCRRGKRDSADAGNFWTCRARARTHSSQCTSGPMHIGPTRPPSVTRGLRSAGPSCFVLTQQRLEENGLPSPARDRERQRRSGDLANLLGCSESREGYFRRGPRRAAYPSSTASSSSSSRVSSPARIFSAIRPAFWRIATSILPAMSGLPLRKVLAFSRPWPMRWLS